MRSISHSGGGIYRIPRPGEIVLTSGPAGSADELKKVELDPDYVPKRYTPAQWIHGGVKDVRLRFHHFKVDGVTLSLRLVAEARGKDRAWKEVPDAPAKTCTREK
jgi:hypothetical protein